MCLCVHTLADVCVHMTVAPSEVKESVGFPGELVSGSCEEHSTGAGNWLRSSARNVIVLNCWPVSTVPHILFFSFNILEASNILSSNQFICVYVVIQW